MWPQSGVSWSRAAPLIRVLRDPVVDIQRCFARIQFPTLVQLSLVAGPRSDGARLSIPSPGHQISSRLARPCTNGQDLSFRETAVGRLPCRLEWHEGFRLRGTEIQKCRVYRSNAAADAIICIIESGDVTPDSCDERAAVVLHYLITAWAWPCMARPGGPSYKAREQPGRRSTRQ